MKTTFRAEVAFLFIFYVNRYVVLRYITWNRIDILRKELIAFIRSSTDK